MKSPLFQFQSYLKIDRQVREATVRFYSEYYSSFFSIPGVDMYIFGDSDRFDTTWKHIMDRDITNNTKKKYLIFMRIFSDFLILQGIITVNLAREKKNPRVQQQLPFALEKTDIVRIYDAIYRKWGNTTLSQRNTMIFDTFICTGIRRGELSKLRKDDIYEDRISIREGKGGRPRLVYIPHEFGKKLIEYGKNTSGDLIFYTQNEKPLADRTYLTIFQVISKELGIRVYPHLLRHTFASYSIQSGIDIYTLQTQMGHRDVSVTSKYLYMNDEERAKQSQKLSFS